MNALVAEVMGWSVYVLDHPKTLAWVIAGMACILVYVLVQQFFKPGQILGPSNRRAEKLAKPRELPQRRRW